MGAPEGDGRAARLGAGEGPALPDRPESAGARGGSDSRQCLPVCSKRRRRPEPISRHGVMNRPHESAGCRRCRRCVSLQPLPALRRTRPCPQCMARRPPECSEESTPPPISPRSPRAPTIPIPHSPFPIPPP
ncbi:hypothetical protein XCR_0596 [Xanthomonas campestris pv. raphani 756C]|nr:hypothetical protein XCR_0596 [Xanthomonas campestris pv. raphani 756C]